MKNYRSFFYTIIFCSVFGAISKVQPVFTQPSPSALQGRLTSQRAAAAAINEQALYKTRLSYTTVNNIETLNEKRIDSDICYGAYMIENSKGPRGSRGYACQDYMFAGTLLGKVMFAVCDGHGAQGDVIARDAITTAPLGIFKHKDTKDGIKTVCKQLQDGYQKRAEAQQSGTSLVCAVIQNDLLTVGHVGNARLMIIRPSRCSIPLATKDHTNEKQMLTRSLGVVELHAKHEVSALPDTQKITLEAHDLIVLASQGYWNVVSNDATYDLVLAGLAKGLDCKALAKKLTEIARESGSKDDISVLCVHYKSK